MVEKVYTFRILYGGDDEFVRDFEVRSGQTLLDLHESIQENLDYEPSQLASFFLSDATWEKREEIPLINMNDDPGIRIMEEVRIEEKSIEDFDRMLYVFDYLSNRGFFIELVFTAPVKRGTSYPKCTRSEGDPPDQLSMDNDLSFLLNEDQEPDTEDDIPFENIDDLDI